MQLFLQFGRAIERTGRKGIFGMTPHKRLVVADRSFRVALFFRSLPYLEQLRSVPTYLFFTGRYELRFFTGLKYHAGHTWFGHNQDTGADKQYGPNRELHEVPQSSKVT